MNLGVTCEMRPGLVTIRAEALRTGRVEARDWEWCLAAYQAEFFKLLRSGVAMGYRKVTGQKGAKNRGAAGLCTST